MSRSFKKNEPVKGESSSEFIATGIVITDGKRKIFIKKAFVSAFGFENGAKRIVPLNPNVFHQIINSKLVKKQKSQEKKREVHLLGPSSNRMGTNNANSFIAFMNEYGLLKNKVYEVVEVFKELKKESVLKKKLELAAY